VTDFGDFVVSFKQNLTYGCSLPFDSAAFQAFCEDPTSQDSLKASEIFKNLDDLMYFG